MKLRLRAAAVGLAIAIPVFAPAASAQSSANTPAVRTIEVDGKGETRTSPDTADLDLAIDTQAKTAEAAANRNAALAAKVIDALKTKLGDKGKITTGGYSLDPQYDERPNRKAHGIIGYNAENTVTVHTGALDLVGPLIDSAIAAGANRVNSLNFSVKNDTRARTEAIAIATRDARAQAEALASALGVKLGKIVKATTVSQARPIGVQLAAMAMSANVATRVEPGEVTVPATVSLTFEIE